MAFGKFWVRASGALICLSISAASAHALECNYTIKNEWSTGFTADLSITNNGASAVDGWQVAMAYTDGTSVANIWNADLSDGFVASNKSYNRTIAAGSTVSFGFNGRKGSQGSPASIPALSGACEAQPDVPEPEPEISEARCEFSIQNEWSSGYTGKVTIFNDQQTAIDGWRVVMQFTDGSTHSGAWNARASGSNPLTLSNESYNARIGAGSSTSFGFNAQKGSPGQDAKAPQLAGICKQISVPNTAPVAIATASSLSGSVPLTVSFDASGSQDAEDQALTYSWQLDGNVVATTSGYAPTFELPGTYSVSVTVNDGDLDSAPVTFDVTALPVADELSYSLNPALSSLHFVSTKKVDIIETHGLTALTGQIGADGVATLSIGLDSIESGIDIRNTRMREHLFETATYSHAQVSVPVDLNALDNLELGARLEQSIEAELDLHGVTAALSAVVTVTKLADGTVMIQNTAPLVIQAEDFALVTGIETLRSLAGLDVISYAVPVNFTLVYSAQSQEQ